MPYHEVRKGDNMISYEIFWKTLKRKDVSLYKLIHKHNVSPSIFTRMKRGEFLSLRKIVDLCEILDCDIADIVRYIPDKTKKNP